MAARAIGTKQTKILFREIIPNVAPSVFGYALVYAALIIAVEGALAFLGLSVQPPTATWGQMLNEARGRYQTDGSPGSLASGCILLHDLVPQHPRRLLPQPNLLQGLSALTGSSLFFVNYVCLWITVVRRFSPADHAG